MYDNITTVSAHFHLTQSQFVAVCLYNRSFHSVGKSILCNLPIITLTSQSPIPHLYLNYQTDTHTLRSVTKQEVSFPVFLPGFRKDYTFFLVTTSPKPSFPPPKIQLQNLIDKRNVFQISSRPLSLTNHCFFTLPQTGSLLKSP